MSINILCRFDPEIPSPVAYPVLCLEQVGKANKEINFLPLADVNSLSCIRLRYSPGVVIESHPNLAPSDRQPLIALYLPVFGKFIELDL